MIENPDLNGISIHGSTSVKIVGLLSARQAEWACLCWMVAGMLVPYVTNGTVRSRGNPTPGRACGSCNPDQKEGIPTHRRDVLNESRKQCVALRVERYGVGVECQLLSLIAGV